MNYIYTVSILLIITRIIQLCLHSILSVAFAVFGGLLLFAALHCNIFPLSSLFPVIIMELVFVIAMLVIFVDPRYHVIDGEGSALALTTQKTCFVLPSCIFSGLSLGLRETLWTSTENIINGFCHALHVFFLLDNFDKAVNLRNSMFGKQMKELR